tara:strand:- start:223 stop:996 length:774 start_codon:yes stop_codon:yes gene_type:complete
MVGNIVKKNKIKKPFFSIITVVKNDEKNIYKTLKSVSSQTFKNFEYVVIDGRSTDKTLEILKKNKRINFLISEKDKGIYYAMNKGLKHSRGKIIVFINSGDIFSKNALKIVHDIFKKNSEISFVFGTVLRKYTKANILKYGYNDKRLIYNFDFATAHSTGFFLKRNIYNLVGNFNTKYKCSSDYDIYYKVIIKNKLLGKSTKKNELIGTVAAGGFSSKISFFNHLKEEIQIRKDNKQNKFFLFLIFINALIKNFLKN